MTQENHSKNINRHRLYTKCGYLKDSQPEKHAGEEFATDKLLEDMAVEDALDELNL